MIFDPHEVVKSCTLVRDENEKKVRNISFVNIPSVCARVRGAGSNERAGSPQAGVAKSVVSA